jgi:cell division protein FtsW (lipid II flippase)
MLGTDRYTFRERLDWPLFLGVVLVSIVGVVNLYSATSPYMGVEGRSGIADAGVRRGRRRDRW